MGGKCTLRVNGKIVGTGRIYIGPIKRGYSRTSNCYVISSKLVRAWQKYRNGEANFNRYITASAKYHYRYYR
ncbi:hypothetical protein ACFFOP_34255 [Sinosporangium siamense]|uniref:hypothetical protein n=1 Tax=Sinosporangium siamense TaxID=1367973 RepID=UPI0035E49B15